MPRDTKKRNKRKNQLRPRKIQKLSNNHNKKKDINVIEWESKLLVKTNYNKWFTLIS